MSMLLIQRFRERARSHRFKWLGAVLSSQPAGFQGAAHSSGVLVSAKRKYE
jgi:hypothetical protein